MSTPSLAPANHQASSPLDNSPGEGQVNVLITFDFEEWEGKYTIYEANLFSKTKRIVDLLAEKNLPATFFLDGETTLRYPEAVRLLTERRHELALHSDYHPGTLRNTGNTRRPEGINVPDFRQDSTTQISRIRNGISMIRQVVPDFNPAGFRAPGLLWNNVLYESLSVLGFQYDSSRRVDVFQPFDVGGITVFPVNSRDYDSACYKMSMRYVLMVWKSEFSKACEAASKLGTSCFVLLAHPSVSGKSKYIGLLKAMLSFMSWKGVHYLTCSEMVSVWRARSHSTEAHSGHHGMPQGGR